MPKLLRLLVLASVATISVLGLSGGAGATPVYCAQNPAAPCYTADNMANIFHTPNYIHLGTWIPPRPPDPEFWASTGSAGQGLSDMAFQNNLAIVGEYSHWQALDVKDPTNPTPVGPNFRCDGSQGDMIQFGHLLFRVNESGTGRPIPNGDLRRPCGPVGPGEIGIPFAGVAIYDVTDWANPKPIIGVPVCGGAHTATGYYNDNTPGKYYIIMTRGGITSSSPQWGLDCSAAVRPGNSLDVVEVPLDHPERAHLRTTWFPTGGGTGGCHDVNVFEELHLMATSCPSNQTGGLVDIADVDNPKVLWTFTYPGISTLHTADFSWNGRYIYWNAEPGGGTGASCGFDDDPILYTVYIVDRFTGKLLGQWHAPNPQGAGTGQSAPNTENCTIHEINEVPFMDRNVMTYACYRCGMGVIDLTNPRAARTIGYMDFPTAQGTNPGGPGNIQGLGGLGCWTGYWYNDNLYCNDLSWGLHIWTITEPWWKQALQMTNLNPQTTTFTFKCTVTVSGGPKKAHKAGTATANVIVGNGHEIEPQAAWGLSVAFKAPGFYKVVKTGENGKASAKIKASKAGKLQVSTLSVENVNSCAAPSKSIGRAAK
jgi:hypothetical protein